MTAGMVRSSSPRFVDYGLDRLSHARTTAMPKYLIERDIPGAGKLTAAELNDYEFPAADARLLEILKADNSLWSNS